MVKSSEVFSTNIDLSDVNLNVKSFYKVVKAKADDLGYGFFEKRQTSKPKKYGDEIEFEFHMMKDYDEFCMGEIKVDGVFKNLKRSKTKDFGDVKISIKAAIILDYDNKWGKNSFNKFLFKIYTAVKKEEFKNKYTTPLWKDTSEIYNTIKESFGLVVS